MNALELADWIKNTDFYDSDNPYINDTMDEVEAMLRQFGLAESIIKQQQIEIEALKKENADMNRRLLGWDIYEQ